MKKAEKTFWFRILRNGLILLGLQIVTLWTAYNGGFEFFFNEFALKTLIVFFLGYVFLEASKFYGIDLKNSPNLKNPKMLFLT